MVDEAKPDHLERIAAEARKVPPLPYVLFLFAVATCPIWISAAVVAVMENLSASPSENFYATARWITLGCMFVSLIVTTVVTRRAKKRRVERAENVGDLSSFRLGWGAGLSVWKGGYSVAVVILLVIYSAAGHDILLESLGVNRSDLTEAGRYWFAIIHFAVASGLFFCFFGFCIWLGRRVQRKRAAR